MKKINLKLFSYITLISSPFSIISCIDTKETNLPKKDNKENADKLDDKENKQPKNDNINKTEKIELSINNHFGKNYNEFSIDEFQNSFFDFEYKVNDKKIEVINFTKIDDEKGVLSFKFKDKIIDFELNGFKEKQSNPFNEENNDHHEDSDEISKYIENDYNYKWNHDYNLAEEYLDKFRQVYPFSSNLSSAEIEEYNQKASKLNLPTYEQSIKLGRLIPYKKEDGTFGYKIPETPNSQFENWYDNFGVNNKHKNHGLARTITNETYATMGMQSYSLVINNSFLPENNEKDKRLLRDVLKYREDFNDMIDQITNSNERNKLRDSYNQIKPNERKLSEIGALKLFRRKLVNQLIKEKYIARGGLETDLTIEVTSEGDFIKLTPDGFDDPKKVERFNLADDEDVWKGIWTPHIRREQRKIITKLNELKTTNKIKSKIIDKVIKAVEKNTDFWDLEQRLNSYSQTAGTTFIIDYQKPLPNQQPKKFYFATNLHVLDGIVEDEFINLGFTRLANESVGNKLKTTSVGLDQYNRYFVNKEAFKIIWTGRDYLNQDPSDWFNDGSIKEKEFIDIAIFEIDFDKVDEINFNGQNKEDFIKDFTYNYSNSDKKAKFVNYDYLKDYHKIDFSKVESNLDNYDMLYALGYPLTDSLKSHNFFDYYLDDYEDARDKELAKSTFSLWTNAKSDFYNFAYNSNDNNLIQNLNKGSGLGYNLNYNTFTNKHGVIDSFISSPKFGKELYKSNNGQKYYNVSLAYNIDRYTPGGGASGSSVRTKDNKIVGTFHVSNYFAYAGLTEAFRSNGFNYEGLFGNYNLPQYDVIYGGGKDQKTSYREKLKQLYGLNYQTYLFENINEIPSEFIFKK